MGPCRVKMAQILINLVRTWHIMSKVKFLLQKSTHQKIFKKTHFYFNLISTTGAQPVKSILIFTLRQILGSLRTSFSTDFVISSSWFPKHAEPMLPVITRMLPTKRCLHSTSTNLASRHQLPKQDPGSFRNGEMEHSEELLEICTFWCIFAHFCHLVNFSLRMKGARRAFQTTSRPQMRDSFTWFPVKYK